MDDVALRIAMFTGGGIAAFCPKISSSNQYYYLSPLLKLKK